MQLAIISDTHMPRGERTLPVPCLERCRRADAILHAGDLIDLSVLELLRSLGPPVHAVCGNVDLPAVRAVLPERLELTFGAVRIGILHDPGPASERARALPASFPDADALIFGHTHVAEHARHGELQLFNPGSPTERRRSGAHTMGLAQIDRRRISFEIVEVG